MKKSFCLVAVLCLLGNVAYALNVTAIADVAKNNSAIHSASVTSFENALTSAIGTKTMKALRPLSDIQSDKALLFGSSDEADLQRLNDLEDEEREFIKKAKSYAGFQRAIAYAYRHELPFDRIITAFVTEFYQ
jgi:hypothetical protein